MASTDRTMWMLGIAASVVSVVLGIMVLVWPDATLLVGAVLFGVCLLVHGIVDIVDAVTARTEDGVTRALSAVVGVLLVIGGVICLRNVLASLLTIATLIGITWLISGILALVSAFGSRYSGNARAMVAVLGAVSVVGGLVVLLWPKLTLVTLVYLLGIWLIVMGIVQFVIVLRTRPRAAAAA